MCLNQAPNIFGKRNANSYSSVHNKNWSQQMLKFGKIQLCTFYPNNTLNDSPLRPKVKP